jgi:hypothetical protein
LFIPSDDPEVSTHGALVINTGSIPLTPERMELLRQLVGSEGLRRQAQQIPIAWEEVVAAASAFFEASD